ncbi:MAG TPA: type VI secretion system protein TssA, partial [Burkholderiaceae bacterium]
MDLDALLAPVSPESPAGADFSFSAEFDAIQEMRREDDPTLDQGEWVAALKTADWPGVVRTCEGLLAQRSKDLRVAGWLADAWARVRGFEGLADGLDLTAGLIDGFWDCVHPRPDGGDPEERIGNLRWLAARVEQLAP